MGVLSVNSLDIQQFCDLQGVQHSDKFVLLKKYKDTKKSYDEWYSIVSSEFQISDKKNFSDDSSSKDNKNKK